MSDDLVKRLRHDGWEAAERIEELEAKAMDNFQMYVDANEARIDAEAKLATCEKYRDAYDKMGRIGTEAYRDLEAKLDWVITERDETFALMLDRAQTAEAKLAKAVEALEKIAQHDMQYWAITTLAELKGERDE